MADHPRAGGAVVPGLPVHAWRRDLSVLPLVGAADRGRDHRRLPARSSSIDEVWGLAEQSPFYLLLASRGPCCWGSPRLLYLCTSRCSGGWAIANEAFARAREDLPAGTPAGLRASACVITGLVGPLHGHPQLGSGRRPPQSGDDPGAAGGAPAASWGSFRASWASSRFFGVPQPPCFVMSVPLLLHRDLPAAPVGGDLPITEPL